MAKTPISTPKKETSDKYEAKICIFTSKDKREALKGILKSEGRSLTGAVKYLIKKEYGIEL
ncbi:MAG: hypothetical protein ACK4NC_05840 [Candidatus Gracilibacteria bacterium]